uniref:Divalent metal cation transporter n=1 Tax=Conchiformibius kuhniae TaxID=211502 RepID=A0A8T9MY03_9NEIS|nr:divalent metal cation transporter [Conchiformibius kuhniae]
MSSVSKQRSALLGAAFLMATSAIGLGFLTQTATFTEKLLASFGFVILLSILLDIGAQLNIWRIVAVSGKRAQDIANEVFPGAGYFLAALIVMGGLAFNIGNVGGAGLGINVLTGLPEAVGVVLSGAVALAVFLFREAGAGDGPFRAGDGLCDDCADAVCDVPRRPARCGGGSRYVCAGQIGRGGDCYAGGRYGGRLHHLCGRTPFVGRGGNGTSRAA